MIYRANRFFQPEQSFRTVSYGVIKAKSINKYIYIYKNTFVYIYLVPIVMGGFRTFCY